MKGDFIGFSFDGIHCSELGITRVSNGDRYKEELFPEISDRSNEIMGADGENYFGSEYRKKTFPIDIAFDSITETQFRKIRKLFGTKKNCELIFDERPYKVYMAKIESPIELEYICFDEHKRHQGSTIQGGGVRYIEKDGEKIKEDITPWIYEYDENEQPITERRYKGEGSIEFVAYYPFARQLYKVLDLYTDTSKVITTYDNVDEWKESSGLLTQAQFDTYEIDQTCEINNGSGYNFKIPVYNPGDLNTGFYLYLPFDGNGTIRPYGNEKYIKIFGDENGLLLTPIYKKSDNENETGVIINTVNHLIEGVVYDPITERNDYRKKSWEISHNIYNECIIAGDFPKILCSDWYLDNDQFKQAVYLSCTGDKRYIQINYDYLYF